MSQDVYVSTGEAAAMLGVQRATIYTYVSRGILRSVRRPGTTSSWFHRSDVEAFARRRSVPGREQRRGRLTETAISNVDGSSYCYRGRDPAALAAEYSFEQVAEFLWTGEIPSAAQWASGPIQSHFFSQDSPSANEAPPMDVLRVAVATLAATDPLRLGNRPEALVATGRHLISSLVDSLPLVGEAPTESSVAARLWARLTATPSTRDGVEALDRLLTIIADHGVSPSALAARVVASYEADLYGAVQAGLSIVSGARRGGLSSSTEVLLEEISRVGDVEAVLGDLYRTKGVPFLAHPRYTRADPRTAQIVDLVASVLPDHEVIAVFREISRIADARSLPAAPVELALAAFARAFEFTRGGSETVFAIGRSAGWVAHAIEAYAQPSPLSPLFSYVGVSSEHEPDLSRVD